MRALSVNRREALVKAYTDKYGAADIYECPICIVESEIHMVQALEAVSYTHLDVYKRQEVDFKGSLVKVDIALAKGKKQYDKQGYTAGTGLPYR